MNKLTYFTRTLERLLELKSKTAASYRAKQKILKQYFCLSKKPRILMLAQENQLSRQYVNQVVMQIQSLMKVAAIKDYNYLKGCYLQELQRAIGQAPAPIAQVLTHFKQQGLVPRLMSLEQFRYLLPRLAINPPRINLWQTDWLLNLASCRNGSQWRQRLILTNKKIEQLLKNHLILAVKNLAVILSCDPLVVERLVKQNKRFICYKSFVMFDWSQQRRKTGLGYLMGKVFALYKSLSAESLLSILRAPTRLTLQSQYLRELADNHLLLGVTFSGLVQQKGASFYAKGDPRFLTTPEQEIIIILNKNGRLQARHIVLLAQNKGWDRGNNNRLIRSPILNRAADGWFRLYAEPQHIVKQPANSAYQSLRHVTCQAGATQKRPR